MIYLASCKPVPSLISMFYYCGIDEIIEVCISNIVEEKVYIYKSNMYETVNRIYQPAKGIVYKDIELPKEHVYINERKELIHMIDKIIFSKL